MTPAINAAKQARVPFQVHENLHNPKAESYGEEVEEKLSLPLTRVFKTLVVNLNGKGLEVAVVPVSDKLDMKACAAALGAKKSEMAARYDAERATSYVLGGISSLGERKLPTVIDASARGSKPCSSAPDGADNGGHLRQCQSLPFGVAP